MTQPPDQTPPQALGAARARVREIVTLLRSSPPSAKVGLAADLQAALAELKESQQKVPRQFFPKSDE